MHTEHEHVLFHNEIVSHTIFTSISVCWFSHSCTFIYSFNLSVSAATFTSAVCDANLYKRKMNEFIPLHTIYRKAITTPFQFDATKTAKKNETNNPTERLLAHNSKEKVRVKTIPKALVISHVRTKCISRLIAQ